MTDTTSVESGQSSGVSVLARRIGSANWRTGSGFALKFGVLFSARLLGAAAMFLSTLLIARQAGPELLAEFALMISAIGILSVFLGGGYNRVGGIFAAAYEAEGLPQRLRGFVQAGAKHIIVGTCVALGLLAAFAALAPGGLFGVTATEGLMVLAGGAGTAALYLLGSILVGLKRQPRGLLPDTLFRPTTFLAVLVALPFILEQDSATPAVFAYVLTIWLACGVALALWGPVRRTVAGLRAEFERVRWRAATYPWAAISLSWDYLIEVMILVAGLIAGRPEIAILYVCFRFRVLAGFGQRSLLMLFLPELSGVKAGGDTSLMRRRLTQLNLLSLAYVAAVAVAFVVAGQWLLRLFGTDMAEGYAPLLIMAVALLPPAIFGPAPQVLAIHNSHLSSAAAMTSGMILAVGLMLVLFPLFGVSGAAAAYAVANFAVYLFLWRQVWQRTGIDCSIFALIMSHPRAVDLKA